MIDTRTKRVRAALEKTIRRPWRYKRNDCAAMVARVVRAIDRDVVLPPWPDGGMQKVYEYLQDCGGLHCYIEMQLEAGVAKGLTYGPHEIRPGDIFVLPAHGHGLGAYLGVFDPGMIPVAWTEESVLVPMEEWPTAVWTYG